MGGGICMREKNRRLAKQLLSVLLCVSMIAPNMAPIIAEAAQKIGNMPRYVDFMRPEALRLKDLRLASDSDAFVDEIPDEDDWIYDEDEINGIQHVATDSEAEVRDPEFYYDSYGSEEPEGQLVQFENAYRTYLIEENAAQDADGNPVHSYVTVVGNSSEMYKDQDGVVRYFDNTLVPVARTTRQLSAASGSDAPKASGSNMRRARSVVTSTRYGNSNGAAQIQIPDEMDQGHGYLLSNGEDTMEVIPMEGEFKSSVVLENAIRYSNVFPGVDFQYTILGNSMKEDIILMEKQERHEFSYRLKSTGLKYKKVGDSVAAYRDSWKEPSFRITAPVMIDDNGAVSYKVRLKFSSSDHIVTVVADKEWLEDPKRAYPVRIDPEAEALVGPEAFTVNMIAKGDNVESIQAGDPWDDEIHDHAYGDTGHTMVGYSEDYGHCRAVIGVNTDWQALLNQSISESEEEEGIQDIQFSIGVLTKDTPNRSPFYLYAIEEAWDTANASYKNICHISKKKLGESDFSSGVNSRLEYLITDTYQQWAAGTKPCYGFMMEVPEEKHYIPGQPETVYWAETLYNRNGGRKWTED